MHCTCIYLIATAKMSLMIPWGFIGETEATSQIALLMHAFIS